MRDLCAGGAGAAVARPSRGCAGRAGPSGLGSRATRTHPPLPASAPLEVPMLLPLAGLLLGAILGALAARRRGGVGADLLQWGAVGAILGGLAGLFLLILISRLLAA